MHIYCVKFGIYSVSSNRIAIIGGKYNTSISILDLQELNWPILTEINYLPEHFETDYPVLYSEQHNNLYMIKN